nr:RNA-directed DNA polymerase, eukaryota [Tanacetum cinerariifolium]
MVNTSNKYDLLSNKYNAVFEESKGTGKEAARIKKHGDLNVGDYGEVYEVHDETIRFMDCTSSKHMINYLSQLCRFNLNDYVSCLHRTWFKEQVFNCDYFIALMGTWAPTSSKLLIKSVYAPQELNERRDLWDFLRTFIDRWEGDTVIMSDFNEVRSEHKRFGSMFNRQWAIAFNNFISSACLIDLPLEGYAFTWAHKSALNMSKLDRYLISEGVLDLFPHLSALCLDRHLSHHRPILMRETNYDYGPSPFRFFHSWFAMEEKLQALKIDIKAWSKEANKRSNDTKINIQPNLSEVDTLIDQGNSNDKIFIKRITLLKDLQELNNRNAMEISQKAKIRWSIEGDENSKYFHGIMNKKRSQLAIRGTLANEEWILEPHRVKNEFFTHFKKQFSPIQALSIYFDFTFPTRLSSDQVQDLERTVTYEEVKRVVWDCGTNKSPGPDGFSFEFYRKYWTTIDDDVFQAVRDFFLNGYFPKGCNSSFIALIPKIQDAKFMKDFDPISLIGSVSKIIAKILANRLCVVLLYLISDVQSNFVANLQILDGPFILNELLLFIGEWNNNNIQTLLSVLRCFYLASGLKINLHKSKLMRIGVSSNVVADAASLIGCSILSAPFNYLDVKVGSNMSRITSWDNVISKVFSRLSKWKLKLLSIGSRLFLLKSVLTSISLYHISILKVPIGVLNHLESIRRNFFMELMVQIGSLLGLAGICVAEKMGHPSLSHSFRRMPKDRWCWSLEGSQEFSVKSFRILIDHTILPKVEVPTRWLNVVPIKVDVHAWTVFLDKLLTRTNFSFRGMDIPSISCLFCNSAVESSSHIFSLVSWLAKFGENF